MKIIYLKLAAITNIFFLTWLLFGRNKENFTRKILFNFFKSTKRTKKYKNNWHATKANSFDINALYSYFENRKPYLDKGLNLDTVANEIGIHKQQLSYIINNKLFIHFPDLLSAYRVKEAQQKLLEPTYFNYTIDAIAQDAGFNSRANFYEAFKKHTGLTPTQYRKKFERKRTEVEQRQFEVAMA
jgi:AraC-like DNA-binding protein